MNMNNFKDKNFLYFYTQKQKETYQKYFSNSANFDENFKKLLKKEFEYLGKTYTVAKIIYDCLNELYIVNSSEKMKYYLSQSEKIYKSIANAINYFEELIFYNRTV